MQHFITRITINELRHLSNLEINLDIDKKQHLLLTGKNGSGKTSLLLEIQKYLRAINDTVLSKAIGEYRNYLKRYEALMQDATDESTRLGHEKSFKLYDSKHKKYCGGIEVDFKNYLDIDKMFSDGKFVTAFYSAERKAVIDVASGVQDIKLDSSYSVESDPGRLLLKYMVHLKTQQSYARNEGQENEAKMIQAWFDRFENALRILLDDDSIQLIYDYKNYNFQIKQTGRNPFDFNQLSDGYSSVLYIVSDLMLRMDRNWFDNNEISKYDEEGIVLIDELETHLHIELQKKILPFLTEFFPNIQFIVTTHSPYILNSIENAKAYDLENHIELENLYMYKADDLAEGYFEADDFSNDLKKDLLEYERLVDKAELSEDEKICRAELRCKLKTSLAKFSVGTARDMFEDIEKRRSADD